MMKTSINRKYALFFGISGIVIMLILVSSFAFIMVRKGDALKKNIKDTGAAFARESHGKTLFNTAQFLSRHLFIPVYQTDIAGVNRVISDMKVGLPYLSFVVADAKGRILTDGTRENRAFGTKLDMSLARLRQQPIIADRTGQGERITFTIGSDQHIAGYGQIVYSNEPLRTSIAKLDALFDTGWMEFRTVFLRISLIGIAAALVIAALLSWLFSGTISRPLLRLKEAADRVAHGDLDCRVEIDTRDELGSLATSFNKMVADLRQSTEELHEANRKLLESSITDRLTGLSNYAHFMDELIREESRASRSKSNFSVILFDLDHFKKVNDTFGHEKGNLLLKAVADILRASARRMDTVARYGGEEFAVLMPDSNGAEHDAAERIRRKIEGAEFTGIADTPLKTTISGGVSTYPWDARTVSELLDKADQALYKAKKIGRNRTCSYEPPGGPLPASR